MQKCGAVNFTAPPLRRISDQSHLRSIVRFVLFFGRVSAADMPFAQVFIQNLPNLAIEFEVDLLQPLGHVFVHRRFARSEAFGAVAHGRARFQNIFRAHQSAFNHIIPQVLPPPKIQRWYILCRIMDDYDIFTLFAFHVSTL